MYSSAKLIEGLASIILKFARQEYIRKGNSRWRVMMDVHLDWHTFSTAKKHSKLYIQNTHSKGIFVDEAGIGKDLVILRNKNEIRFIDYLTALYTRNLNKNNTQDFFYKVKNTIKEIQQS